MPPPAEPISAATRAERQQALLDSLAEAGRRMALEVERQSVRVEGCEPELSMDVACLAYDRVTRAVRLTVLLQKRLAEEEATREDRAARAEAERQADVVDPQFEASEEHKLRVERIVDRVIRGTYDNDEKRERLSVEVHDRLDDEDLYGEVMKRPVGELVALICRDLDIQPDWTRLAEEAWAVAERAAAPPGSPFLDLPSSNPEAATVAGPDPSPSSSIWPP